MNFPSKQRTTTASISSTLPSDNENSVFVGKTLPTSGINYNEYHTYNRIQTVGGMSSLSSPLSYVACHLRRGSCGQSWGFSMSQFEEQHVILADVNGRCLNDATEWCSESTIPPDPEMVFCTDPPTFEKYFLMRLSRDDGITKANNSSLESKTLLQGDMIISIDGRPVSVFSSLQRIVGYLKQCRELRVVAVRHQDALLRNRSVWVQPEGEIDTGERMYLGAHRSYRILRSVVPNTYPNLALNHGRNELHRHLDQFPYHRGQDPLLGNRERKPTDTNAKSVASNASYLSEDNVNVLQNNNIGDYSKKKRRADKDDDNSRVAGDEIGESISKSLINKLKTQIIGSCDSIFTYTNESEVTNNLDYSDETNMDHEDEQLTKENEGDRWRGLIDDVNTTVIKVFDPVFHSINKASAAVDDFFIKSKVKPDGRKLASAH